MNAVHALLQAVADQPERPNTARHTLIPVTVGDQALTAECSITGRHRAAITQADPEFCRPAESPEVEVVRLWLSGPWRDVSGLMEDAYFGGDVRAQCDAFVEENPPDAQDPDDAYDRWRDAQMERAR